MNILHDKKKVTMSISGVEVELSECLSIDEMPQRFALSYLEMALNHTDYSLTEYIEENKTNIYYCGFIKMTKIGEMMEVNENIGHTFNEFLKTLKTKDDIVNYGQLRPAVILSNEYVIEYGWQVLDHYGLEQNKLVELNPIPSIDISTVVPVLFIEKQVFN